MGTVSRMLHRTNSLTRSTSSLSQTKGGNPVPEGKTPNAEVGEMNESSIEGQCPMRAPYPTESGRTNESWWPKKLNLKILAKNPVEVDPFGGTFDYAAAFGALDLAAVKSDIEAVLTTSQDWWPADLRALRAGS